MARLKLDSETRQEQILEAALDIVSRKGMSALSIGAVARQVGVVPSALYRHFDGKDAIIDALLQFIESRLIRNVAEARAAAENPVSALDALFRLHVNLVRGNAGIPRIVFSEEVYAGNSHRKNRMYRLLQRYVEQLAELFREGQSAGTVRTDIGADELGVMFLGLIQPAAILWHTSDGGFDVTRQTEKAWRVFRDAIDIRQADERRG